MSNLNLQIEEQFEESTTNNGKPYFLTNGEYNLIKQLVRFSLAERIENNASDRVIDWFINLDASLTKQFNRNNIDPSDGDLPF
jgi:hypothetical protein